jgi:hypothetical protein
MSTPAWSRFIAAVWRLCEITHKRHTHSTILENSDVKKVLQMDRRGHAMAGMDNVYVHVTDDMRQHLCDILKEHWRTAIAERYRLAPRSAVPILNEILLAHAQASGA